MGRRFDAVLFDAGGVLVLPHPAQVIEALAHLGVSDDHDDHIRGHYRGMRAVFDHSLEVDHWPAFNHAYAAEVGLGDHQLAEADQIINTLAVSQPFLWSYVNPGAREVLGILADAGIPTGVVSNASGAVEQVLAEVGVCQVGPGAGAEVAVVVDSHHVGVEKPDPAIFSFALEVIDVPAHRVLYVGDTVRNDVLGARAAGLHPLQLDPYDFHADAAQARGLEPWDRAGSLTEVLEIVLG